MNRIDVTTRVVTTPGEDVANIFKNFEEKLNSRLDSFQKHLQDTKATLQNNITESSKQKTQDIAQIRGVIINKEPETYRCLAVLADPDSWYVCYCCVSPPL